MAWERRRCSCETPVDERKFVALLLDTAVYTDTPSGGTYLPKAQYTLNIWPPVTGRRDQMPGVQLIPRESRCPLGPPAHLICEGSRDEPSLARVSLDKKGMHTSCTDGLCVWSCSTYDHDSSSIGALVSSDHRPTRQSVRYPYPNVKNAVYSQ